MTGKQPVLMSGSSQGRDMNTVLVAFCFHSLLLMFYKQFSFRDSLHFSLPQHYCYSEMVVLFHLNEIYSNRKNSESRQCICVYIQYIYTVYTSSKAKRGRNEREPWADFPFFLPFNNIVRKAWHKSALIVIIFCPFTVWKS